MSPKTNCFSSGKDHGNTAEQHPHNGPRQHDGPQPANAHTIALAILPDVLAEVRQEVRALLQPGSPSHQEFTAGALNDSHEARQRQQNAHENLRRSYDSLEHQLRERNNEIVSLKRELERHQWPTNPPAEAMGGQQAEDGQPDPKQYSLEDHLNDAGKEIRRLRRELAERSAPPSAEGCQDKTCPPQGMDPTAPPKTGRTGIVHLSLNPDDYAGLARLCADAFRRDNPANGVLLTVQHKDEAFEVEIRRDGSASAQDIIIAMRKALERAGLVLTAASLDDDSNVGREEMEQVAREIAAVLAGNVPAQGAESASPATTLGGVLDEVLSALRSGKLPALVVNLGDVFQQAEVADVDDVLQVLRPFAHAAAEFRKVSADEVIWRHGRSTLCPNDFRAAASLYERLRYQQ